MPVPVSCFTSQLLGCADTKANVSGHNNEGDTDQDDDSDKEGDSDDEASDTDDDSAIEEDDGGMEKTDDSTVDIHPVNTEADDVADMKEESSSGTLTQQSEGSHQTEREKRDHLLVIMHCVRRMEKGKWVGATDSLPTVLAGGRKLLVCVWKYVIWQTMTMIVYLACFNFSECCAPNTSCVRLLWPL